MASEPSGALSSTACFVGNGVELYQRLAEANSAALRTDHPKLPATRHILYRLGAPAHHQRWPLAQGAHKGAIQSGSDRQSRGSRERIALFVYGAPPLRWRWRAPGQMLPTVTWARKAPRKKIAIVHMRDDQGVGFPRFGQQFQRPAGARQVSHHDDVRINSRALPHDGADHCPWSPHARPGFTCGGCVSLRYRPRWVARSAPSLAKPAPIRG